MLLGVVGLLYILRGNENALVILRACLNMIVASPFVVLGRCILYQYNVVWPVSHKFD
jgi:hypothetical protein